MGILVHLRVFSHPIECVHFITLESLENGIRVCVECGVGAGGGAVSSLPCGSSTSLFSFIIY